MMSFSHFINKYNLKKSNFKNENSSSTWFYWIKQCWSLFKDGPFENGPGIVTLHPLKGTHWVVYINENYFDPYGWSPPRKLSKFIIKRNGLWLYSEYKIQDITNKRDSPCSAYCLYIIYLIKV